MQRFRVEYGLITGQGVCFSLLYFFIERNERNCGGAANIVSSTCIIPSQKLRALICRQYCMHFVRKPIATDRRVDRRSGSNFNFETDFDSDSRDCRVSQYRFTRGDNNTRR